MKTALLAGLLALGTGAAQAQSAPAFTLTCQGSERNQSQKSFCETRELTMPAAGADALTIDGGSNGGITVRGYAGSEVRVRAKVSAWATSAEAAQKISQSITIEAQQRRLHATGPQPHHWAVSYEVLVPERTSLVLKTVNGGIRVEHVRGDIAFEAVNGGVSLDGVSGRVKGETTNGGLDITLAGTSWEGSGLDVATTNGGITWKLPANYSAQFYTSTNLGGIKAPLPITSTGMLSKEIAAKLGEGGAPVRAVTTNGGIRVLQ